MPWLSLLSFIGGVIVFGVMQYVAIVSFIEKEIRAAKISLSLGLLLPLLIILSAFLTDPISQAIKIGFLFVSVLVVLILIIPTRNPVELEGIPRFKIDERDIMFSRNLLEEGSERFDNYYAENPDKKAPDDKFRKNPGLMNDKSAHFNPIQFAVAEANFTTVKFFHAGLDKKPYRNRPITINDKDITFFIKEWALKLGSVSVGITELKDYHLYSHVGRGVDFGKKVKIDHKYAIVITVEMDKYMMDHAPCGPVIMESSQQYLNSGTIAVQIAEFILNLGYPARAHIDGNYRVVCPLVARDAGLGEIGRMGLLMTPELGPRVRIAVVTTDLPLIPDVRKPDPTVIDFCTICKKCADVCPSQAISFIDRGDIAGVKRWQINSEACFTLWTKIGTDCGRCITVCPYSHPDNLLHNFIRFGVKNSSVFRWFALKMDDFFYGRKPAPVKPRNWLVQQQN